MKWSQKLQTNQYENRRQITHTEDWHVKKNQDKVKHTLQKDIERKILFPRSQLLPLAMIGFVSVSLMFFSCQEICIQSSLSLNFSNLHASDTNIQKQLSAELLAPGTIWSQSVWECVFEGRDGKIIPLFVTQLSLLHLHKAHSMLQVWLSPKMTDEC